MLRAVLDTNVLVAALLSPAGTPAALMRALARGEFDAAACPALVAELRGVLARPAIARRAAPAEARAFADWFERTAVAAPDPAAAPHVSPDPSDDFLVALAIESGAPLLVTGDSHLLDLGLRSPRVVTPAAFAAFLDEVR